MGRNMFLKRAAEFGLEVSKPWGDTASYDFIVEKAQHTSRVQVKSTIHRRKTAYVCKIRNYGNRCYATAILSTSWPLISFSKICGTSFPPASSLEKPPSNSFRGAAFKVRFVPRSLAPFVASQILAQQFYIHSGLRRTGTRFSFAYSTFSRAKSPGRNLASGMLRSGRLRQSFTIPNSFHLRTPNYASLVTTVYSNLARSAC